MSVASPQTCLADRARETTVLVEHQVGDIRWERVVDDHGELSRGIVILGRKAVPIFPHIPRVVALHRGIARHLHGPFVAEEKLDGYNIRLAWHDGRALPFTRGGLFCPFTYDRLDDLADVRPFFEAHPDLVICCEIAGPGNPYIDTRPPGAENQLRMFVFDVMRLNGGGPLPVEERDALLAGFDLPRAAHRGHFEAGDIDGVTELILRMDREGCEGAVFKSLEDEARVKYVTPAQNFRDVLSDSELVSAMDPNYYRNRLYRLVVGLYELDLVEERREAAVRALGEGLLDGLLSAIDKVAREGEIATTVQVDFRTEAAADQFMHQTSRIAASVHIKEVGRTYEDGFVRVALKKRHRSATDKLKDMLEGAGLID